MKNLNLKKIREQLGGVTQNDLATMIGVTLRTVQRYENESQVPESIYKAIQYEILTKSSVENVVSEPMEEYRISVSGNYEKEYLEKMNALLSERINFLESELKRIKSNSKKQAS